MGGGGGGGGVGGLDASAKHEKKLSLMIFMIKSFLTVKHVKHNESLLYWL